MQKSFFVNRHFAIVQNPQTNIFELSRQHVINYFNTYVDTPNEEEYKSTLKKYNFIYKIQGSQLSNVIYFQNESDELHVNKHLKPFLNEAYEMREGYLYQKEKNNYYFVGNWGEGHAILPSDILETVLQFVIKRRSLDGIVDYICSLEQLRLLEKERYVELLNDDR